MYLVNVYEWTTWEICVQPDGGWGPRWTPGLLTGVVVLVGFLLSGLLYGMLTSQVSNGTGIFQ